MSGAIHDQIKPYASLVLLDLGSQKVLDRKTLKAYLSTIYSAIDSSKASETTLIESKIKEVGKTLVGISHYKEEKNPSWANDEYSLKDSSHHVVVLCQSKSILAIHFSDSKKRSVINALVNNQAFPAKKLKFVESHRLKSLGLGKRACSLWLGGVHRRVDVKADSKLLLGNDLKYVLDPGADSSYLFTSGRFVSGRESVGVSPFRSQVWVRSVADISDFVECVKQIVSSLTASSRINVNDDLFSILANDVVDISFAENAFEFALQPFEIVRNSDLMSEETLDLYEGIESDVRFEIKDVQNQNFTLVVRENVGDALVEIGEVRFEPIQLKKRVHLKGEQIAADGYAKRLDEIFSFISNPSLVQIWYETGHCISHGVISEVAKREHDFKYFEDRQFKPYEVNREKPDNLDEVQSDKKKSLFSWIVNEWAFKERNKRSDDVWLVCDDKSGEIADFLWCSSSEIKFIHVKASNSSRSSRRVSVGAFEIVVSQALKNLRSLDINKIIEHLQSDKRLTGSVVWRNGKPAMKKDFLKFMGGLTHNLEKEVVILQPHIILSKYKKSTAKARPLLNALLWNARNSIRGHGAEFTVVCSK